MTTLIIPDDHPNHRVLLRRARRQSARSPSTSLPRRRSHSHSRRRPPRRPASHRSSPSTSLSRSRSSVRTASFSSRRASWSSPRRRRWRPLIAPLIAHLIATLIAPLIGTTEYTSDCASDCAPHHASDAPSPSAHVVAGLCVQRRARGAVTIHPPRLLRTSQTRPAAHRRTTRLPRRQ